MSKRCARCGRILDFVAASVFKNGKTIYYCHENEGITCYMAAGWGGYPEIEGER